MKSRVVFALFVVSLLFYSCVQAKKSKTRWQAKLQRRIRTQQRLRTICEMQRKANLTPTALELEAYFDLNEDAKPFACLKVSTCSGAAMCFITTHEYFTNKSIDDMSTWQELVTYIQRDRKIEPIYDSSMSGWNGDKYKALNKYVQKPAIYRMCKSATVYRFVVNENVSNVANNSEEVPTVNSSWPTSGNLSNEPAMPVNSNPANSNPATTLCPMFKRMTGKSTRIKRVGQTTNKTSGNFFMCQGFNCPCVRICVGQGGRGDNFTECSTFKIICTFNCGSDTIDVPRTLTTIPKYSRKSSRSRKTRPLRKSKSSRKHRRKTKGKSKTKSPSKNKNNKRRNKGKRKGSNRKSKRKTPRPTTG